MVTFESYPNMAVHLIVGERPLPEYASSGDTINNSQHPDDINVRIQSIPGFNFEIGLNLCPGFQFPAGYLEHEGKLGLYLYFDGEKNTATKSGIPVGLIQAQIEGDQRPYEKFLSTMK